MNPSSTPLYTVAEIRRIEQAALAALPAGTLMQRAGQAAAEHALRLLAEGGAGRARILALAGPGNNGGDALEAAARLAYAGHAVEILFLGDPGRLSADAAQALVRAKVSPAAWLAHAVPAPVLAPQSGGSWSLVIDGLFGIGLARPIAGAMRQLVESLGALPCPVLALDVPSGLDADTGAVVGPDGIALRASHTLTFIGDKPGLHTAAGRDHAGQVCVARLEIEEQHFVEAQAFLCGIDAFAPALKRRPQDSHKGSFGDLAVLGGAAGMGGAPVLAARAAAFAGAGRVFAGFLEQAPAYDAGHPELMCRRAADLDFARMTVVAGPGMGTSSEAAALLARVLDSGAPCVLDADALNLVAAEPELQRKLTQRTPPTLLTPHPLEAARLLQVSAGQVQADRPAAARELAQRFNAIAALKGSGTIVAQPQGRTGINPTGNPALATAGSGDVLSGFCGALLAQKWPAWEAALGAVWMHGAAADALVAQDVGPIGLTAGELIPALRTVLNRLTAQHAA